VTSNDPNASSVQIPVTVTITSNQMTYSGRFNGTVQNSDNDSSDPDGPFTDSDGGAVTMTVTPNSSGGYTLQSQGILQTTYQHSEDFSANLGGSLNVSSLSQITFQTTMGDELIVVQGGVVNGDFTGTWRFVPTNSSDNSDSGSGTFDLFLTY
jgi:hypothetical protein